VAFQNTALKNKERRMYNKYFFNPNIINTKDSGENINQYLNFDRHWEKIISRFKYTRLLQFLEVDIAVSLNQ